MNLTIERNGEPEGRTREEDLGNWGHLTAREEEVARLGAYGLGNAEIASRLTLSIRTVEGHMTGAIGKLGVRSRRQVAEVARRIGVVPPLPGDDPGRPSDSGRKFG